MISLRRQLLNLRLREFESRLHGKVLDIGGKRGFAKGGYQLPYEKAQSWKTLNRDPSAQPDYVCDASNIPVREASFDTVLLIEVVEYLKEPGEVLNEIHRVLREGGELIFSSPMIFPIHGDDNEDRVRWTAVKIRECLAAHGFVVSELIPLGSVGSVIHDILFVSLSYGGRSPHTIWYRALRGLLRVTRPLFESLDTLTQRQMRFITTGYFGVATVVKGNA